MSQFSYSPNEDVSKFFDRMLAMQSEQGAMDIQRQIGRPMGGYDGGGIVYENAAPQIPLDDLEARQIRGEQRDEGRDLRKQWQDLYVSRIAADEQMKRDQKAMEFASNLQMKKAMEVKQLELKLSDADAEQREPILAEIEKANNELSDLQSKMALAQARAGKTADEATKAIQAKKNEYETLASAQKALTEDISTALKDPKFADNYYSYLTGTSGALGYNLGSALNPATMLERGVSGLASTVMGSPVSSTVALATEPGVLSGGGTKQIDRNALAAASMWNNGALTKLPMFEGALGAEYLKDVGQRTHAAETFTTGVVTDMFKRALTQTGKGGGDVSEKSLIELLNTLHTTREGGDLNDQSARVRALVEKVATEAFGTPNQAASVVHILDNVLDSASSMGRRENVVQSLAESGKSVTPETLQAAALAHLGDNTGRLRGRLRAVTKFQFPTIEDLTTLQTVYQKALDAHSPELLSQTLETMAGPQGEQARKMVGADLASLLASSRTQAKDVLGMQAQETELQKLMERRKAAQVGELAKAGRRAGAKKMDILETMLKSRTP